MESSLLIFWISSQATIVKNDCEGSAYNTEFSNMGNV